MEVLEQLADGWVVWNEEPMGRVVLAYRPDVFDSELFPAACLPTITVAPGTGPDRPVGWRERSGFWYVALYLEPDVRVRSADASFESRDDAVARAVELATEFSSGEIDYRSAYQLPRESYLEMLDELLGVS